MLSRTATILLLSLASVEAARAAASVNPLQWIDRNFFRKIQLTGRRELGYRVQTVEGDRDAYNSTTYYGLGGRRFTDVGQMSISGRSVLGVFNFDFTISDNRFQDPQSQKISLDYIKGPLTVNLGDVRGSLLNTNRFASFSKQLFGASAQYRSGRFAAKVVRSEAKGSARTVPIQGNNSAGPYYLLASQILIDSQEVQVDGVLMKPGIDYVINYDVGSITFVSRVIPPTSTIVATFEVLGFNASKGTVQGGGLSYDMGRFGRLGFTSIEQRSGATRGLNTRLEEFQGYGAASNWYTLQFEPLISRPITVRLNGVVQVPGVHYVFDPNIGSLFRFLFDVPPTSTISVTYTPKPTQTIDGDRRVIGFDYRLPIGKDSKNYVQYSQASGGLVGSVTPLSGVARGIDGAYSWGPFQFRGAIRDVPYSFVGIETRGFNRNDRSVESELTYQKGPLQIAAGHQNSSISLRQIDADGNPVYSTSRTTTARVTASYRPDKSQPWSMELLRTSSLYAGNQTKLDTARVSTTRSIGKVATKWTLERQNGYGPLTTGFNPQLGSLSLNTVRVNADYSSSGIVLGLKGSLSEIAAGGKSGKGSDVGISALYNPSERLSVQAAYNVSNSGQLATLGMFQNGLGLGYDNNGFSGGVGQGFSAGATDYRVLTLNAGYKLSPRISLDAQLYKSRSSGTASTNSETSSAGFGLNWDLGAGHLMALSLDQSDTRFIGSGNRSSATALNATLVGSPTGPWSYRLGLSALVSGGNGAYNQDSVFFDAFLGHRINDRQRLNLIVQGGMTQGYLPQRETYAALMYQYQLFQNVALVGSYKWRRVANTDPSLTTGAFRARGFDIELSFNFGG